MLRLKLCLLLFISIINFSEAVTSDSNFILETKSLQPYFSGYIGNGHFSLASTPLGITDAQSYMEKVYDHGPEDVPRVAVEDGATVEDCILLAGVEVGDGARLH
ncbi:hypothetical protein L0152_03725, partial [bacterium]|nr:hypothetical protein [bacterium]